MYVYIYMYTEFTYNILISTTKLKNGLKMIEKIFISVMWLN